MAFFSTAAELTRQYKQNRDDIEALYDLLDKTNKEVKETKTKVDNLSSRVEGLDTKFDNLSSRVGGLDTKVDSVSSRVDGLGTKFDDLSSRVDRIDTTVNNLGSRFDGRFDRLEQLVTQPTGERAPSSPQATVRTPQEKKLGLLEMRLNGALERASDNRDEIERHNRIFDVYDERFAAQDRRFDTLDSQMSEVLSILRGKSA